MGLNWNGFPWTCNHHINLDWFISKFAEWGKYLETFLESAEAKVAKVDAVSDKVAESLGKMQRKEKMWSRTDDFSDYKIAISAEGVIAVEIVSKGQQDVAYATSGVIPIPSDEFFSILVNMPNTYALGGGNGFVNKVDILNRDGVLNVSWLNGSDIPLPVEVYAYYSM